MRERARAHEREGARTRANERERTREKQFGHFQNGVVGIYKMELWAFTKWSCGHLQNGVVGILKRWLKTERYKKASVS